MGAIPEVKMRQKTETRQVYNEELGLYERFQGKSILRIFYDKYTRFYPSKEKKYVCKHTHFYSSTNKKHIFFCFPIDKFCIFSLRFKHALVACGAVAAVATDAERGTRVALLPAADEGGLADEGTRKADVLDLCGVQHVVDELQAAQAAHEGHRDIHLVGQPRGGVEERAFVHAGADTLPRGAVGADLNSVDAHKQLARRNEILLGHSARIFVGGVNLYGDKEVGGSLAPHIGEDGREDMGAMIAVCAVVEQRRDETAEIEKVGSMYLHAVVAGLLGTAGGVAKRRDHIVHFGGREFVDWAVYHRRLQQDAGPVAVHGIGETTMSGDESVVVKLALATNSCVGGRDGGEARNKKRRATLGQRLIGADNVVGDEAFVICQPQPSGRPPDAVAQLGAAQNSVVEE